MNDTLARIRRLELWAWGTGNPPAHLPALPDLGMSQWQDINTAPRDGTWFLARGDFGRHAGDYEVLRFAGENGTAGQHGPFIWATPSSETSVWAESVPTHWMPLPTPPGATS